MSPAERRSVLIAGGGIAGLALARALARRGLPALVLERRAAQSDAGLAINLPGNAVTALAALGLGEELAESGRPMVRREYRSAADRLLFTVDEDAFWGEVARPRVVRRSDLLRLLAGGAQIKSGEVRTVRQNRERVDVELVQGSVLQGDLVVGADGIGSAVRRAVTGAGRSEDALLAAASWRFMVPNPGVDCWTLWAGARSMILLIPLDGDEVYGWAAATGARPASRGAPAMYELSDEFPWRVRQTVEAALAAPAATHLSPLQEVRPTNWGGGRILLIGDAAHACAPVWAQGAALAIEDALVLARLLAERPDWSGVGAELAQVRRPRVDHVRRMTDRMSRAALLPAWLRDRLMPFIGPNSYRTAYEPLRESVEG